MRNGWNEWSRYVLAELKRLNEVCEKLRTERESADKQTQEKLFIIHGEITALKAQAAAWGAAAGIGGAFLIKLLLK